MLQYINIPRSSLAGNIVWPARLRSDGISSALGKSLVFYFRNDASDLKLEPLCNSVVDAHIKTVMHY